MADTTFVSGVTVTNADWFNDINDFFYTTFGAVGGKAYIGDTSNANMTIGLTINQGAADNEILAIKSSDVAHGMTALAETDTYGLVQKYDGPSGGIHIRGFGEATIGAVLSGHGVTDDTVKSTSAVGYISLIAYKKSGTTADVAGADANLLTINNAAATRFIFDAEGSAHADVEWVAFDKYDDVALIEAMNMESQRRQGDPIKREYSKWLKENKAILQREGIVNYYDKNGKRAMVNTTRQAMLHSGAIRQLAKKVNSLEGKLLALTDGT